MRWELQQMCTLKKHLVAGFPSIDGWMDRLEVRLVMHDSCLPLVLPVTKEGTGIDWAIYLQRPEGRKSRNPIDDRSKSIISWAISLPQGARVGP